MREGFRVALVFLTRLPVRSRHRLPLAETAPWFPVVGAVVGLLAGTVFAAATLAGVPSFPAAILVLACLVLLTGALHEDGLADCADALGPHDRERRLQAMRDSRIGSFGTMALILVTLARVAGLSTLWDPLMQVAALVVVGALSRSAMVVLMAAVPPARSEGLAAQAGRPDTRSVAIACGLAALLALLLLGPLTAAALIAVALAVLVGWGWLARRAFGGQTGDVLGAGQQLVEAAALLTLTAVR